MWYTLMEFFLGAMDAKGRGDLGLQWYPAGYRVWGTTYSTVPFPKVVSKPEGRLSLMVWCSFLNGSAYSGGRFGKRSPMVFSSVFIAGCVGVCGWVGFCGLVTTSGKSR